MLVLLILPPPAGFCEPKLDKLVYSHTLYRLGGDERKTGLDKFTLTRNDPSPGALTGGVMGDSGSGPLNHHQAEIAANQAANTTLFIAAAIVGTERRTRQPPCPVQIGEKRLSLCAMLIIALANFVITWYTALWCACRRYHRSDCRRCRQYHLPKKYSATDDRR